MVKSRDSMISQGSGTRRAAHKIAGVIQGVVHIFATNSTTHVGLAAAGLVSQIAISRLGRTSPIESSSSSPCNGTGNYSPDGGCT
jgi:hypothetical protein